jgi:hypothetical protein
MQDVTIKPGRKSPVEQEQDEVDQDMTGDAAVRYGNCLSGNIPDVFSNRRKTSEGDSRIP